MTFDAFTKSLVDRFGAAIPHPYTPSPNYSIVFPTADDWRDFLQRQNAEHLDGRCLLKRITNTALPISAANLPEPWDRIVENWWQETLKSQPMQLAFPMINRLAEYLLRERPHILRALRQSYPFVFLDEFQDTTDAQYEFLRTAFHGSRAKLTAMGDDKQRIMGWAGAMQNGFATFTNDFNAQSAVFHANYRSHADLVQIQHVIAQNIDANTTQATANAAREVEGEVSAIWRYDTQDDEQNSIARWIAGQVQKGIMQSHKCALLVRKRADIAESDFADAFAEQGLILRNVARQAGGVAIQDILTEEYTQTILPLLRLGAQKRAPQQWQDIIARYAIIHAIEDDDEKRQDKLRKDLEVCIKQMREVMKAGPNQETCEAVLNIALDFLDDPSLRAALYRQQNDNDYQRIQNGFNALLDESISGTENWKEALDRFEGIGQVPLMTIHKSKGLEFHTMVFIGFDNRSWWSLDDNREGEMEAFYVAFTRARQRAYFSFCEDRGRNIDWLQQILEPAGVSIIEGP